MTDLIANPLVVRAATVGVFGGVGLALTSLYSRRGPLIFPVYAALLAALALLLVRHSELAYGVRMLAALDGFTIASFILYMAIGLLARKQREHLIAAGRLPSSSRGVSLTGHLWRWAFLLGIGTVVSAALAFVSA